MKAPPKWLSRVLEWCTPHDRSDVLGDFEEWHAYLSKEQGLGRANFIILFHSLTMLQLKIISRSKDKTRYIMNGLSFKIASRNLRKNKLYTIINTTGLGVGLAACVLIAIFIRQELSYDTHFVDYENVYRVAGTLDQGGDSKTLITYTPYLLAPAMESNLDSAVLYTRMDFMTRYVEVGENDFWEDYALGVDKNFFEVFGMKFIEGSPEVVLKIPMSVVLDESTARKYFEEDNPIGQAIEMDDLTYHVSGVVADLPENTHFEANLFFPMASIEDQYPYWMTATWGGVSHRTYFKVPANYNVAQLEQGLNEMIATYSNDDDPPGYFFQALEDIHLKSDLVAEIQVNGSYRTLYIFLATAIVILILACINFINLSIAGSIERLKEIGVKKVLGASRKSQIWQFQFESILVGCIASILTVVLVQFSLPLFNSMTGKELSVGWEGLLFVFLSCVALIFIISLLAGSFPALFLLKVPTSNALSGAITVNRRSRLNPRNTLVGLQFFLSAILISCTLVILRQLDYMQNKDLGIDTDQLIVAPFQANSFDNYELLRKELLNQSAVLGVTASTNNLSFRVGGWRQYRKPNATENINLPTVVVAHDYFETIAAEFVEGRPFMEDYTSDDQEAYIINEAAVRFLELENPVGEKLLGSAFTGSEWSNKDAKIIGVIKDFHFSSLHDKIRPVVFSLSSEVTIPLGHVIIKISPENIIETLELIEQKWESVNPNTPLRYQFVDEAIGEHYLQEVRFLKVFSAFAVLSIFIGGLGLFGLTAFIMKKRVKEIGIRKVLGANQLGLVKVLSVDFILLVVIASIMGIPVTVWLMKNWLASFEYRISIAWWLFVLTIVGAVIAGMLSILYHSVKVARTNPVDSINYE